MHTKQSFKHTNQSFNYTLQTSASTFQTSVSTVFLPSPNGEGSGVRIQLPSFALLTKPQKNNEQSFPALRNRNQLSKTLRLRQNFTPNRQTLVSLTRHHKNPHEKHSQQNASANHQRSRFTCPSKTHHQHRQTNHPPQSKKRMT